MLHFLLHFSFQYFAKYSIVLHILMLLCFVYECIRLCYARECVSMFNINTIMKVESLKFGQ